MKTQKQIRDSFWSNFPEYANEKRSRKKQNDYKCDIRCAFVDYVDMLAKDGEITWKMARKVTL